jgi:predicted cation transporter
VPSLEGHDVNACETLGGVRRLQLTLTITGSIANIIVVERAAAERVHVGFREYARVGVPVTVATLLIGSLCLWITG